MSSAIDSAMTITEKDIIDLFNFIHDVMSDDDHDYSLLKCNEIETKDFWEKRIMNVKPCDWSKYDFKRSYSYLQQYGLRGGTVSIDSEWMKILVNTQIYGGVGTIDDMISYAGYNSERVVRSRKYRLVNFLRYYHIIEEVKRVRNGGRVFEITRFGEDLIDFAAKN